MSGHSIILKNAMVMLLSDSASNIKEKGEIILQEFQLNLNGKIYHDLMEVVLLGCV